MATKALKASCLCGAAKHDLSIPESSLPLKLTFCHCNSCRHYTGTLQLTVAVLPYSYSPASDLIDKLKHYEFFPRIDDYFCPTCGTHMLFYVKHSGGDPDSNGYWAVHTGSLEQVDGILEPDVHWFVGDTLDGGFADFFPTYNDNAITRYAGFKEKSEELPLYWESPERPQVIPSPSDKLHCYCRCGGIEFWIARPSERSKKASGAWPDLLIPHFSDQSRPDGSAWWLRDNGKKFLAGLCSCNSCRLDTGFEWIEWAFVPTIDITLDAEGKVPFATPFGTLKGYRSFHDVTRYHCDTCGASAIYQTDDRTDLVDVAVGLMDAPEGARAESWLEWRTTRLSFREDALPRAKGLTLAVESGLEQYGKRNEKYAKQLNDDV